jgi:hypothetical protein
MAGVLIDHDRIAIQKRYSPNAVSPTLTVDNPHEFLLECLTSLVKGYPPGDTRRVGFFGGTTSVAYLFFHLSLTHTSLVIESKSCRQWMEEYLDQPEPALQVNRYGIMNEYLCWTALKAVSFHDHSYLDKFLAAAERIPVEGDPTLSEVIIGSAGALMILRFVRCFEPSQAERIDAVMEPIITATLDRQPWTLQGKRIVGAAHGDVGIITQIVLCDPSRASALEKPLKDILELQLPDGNWPYSVGVPTDLVQWCHGAPGFLISLKAIRDYFPTLHQEIDNAVSAAQNLIWEKGVLLKEPNLCHGITGNALALEPKERSHLLALSTPDRVRESDWERMKDRWGLFTGEAGRAWVWAMLDGGRKGFPAYTEV